MDSKKRKGFMVKIASINSYSYVAIETKDFYVGVTVWV